MKVIHLNYSDINGGAARATYRIHQALRGAGIDSYMWVNEAKAGDWTVERPAGGARNMLSQLRPRLGALLMEGLKTGNPIIHSPSILPSGWVKRLNSSDADIVHLHWIQGEMLSVADVGRIEKPVVWTLHDMWAFCGAEHYTEDFRWREGYRRDNRPTYESGFDINRWTWSRKRRHWKQPIQIVTPSGWLADCVRESALMRDWPVDLISYPINVDRWKPIEQHLARDLLGLPRNVPLLLFGAMGGGKDPRKGFDLLSSALKHLAGVLPRLEIVVFGEQVPREPPDLGFPAHFTGHLYDELSLRALYSAADVFALPSRQDNLPLTCMEALSCGSPVVAFNSSGPPTMIRHKHAGFLAPQFDSKAFAEGICWVLQCPDKDRLRHNARAHAERLFNPSVVAQQYVDIYKKTRASSPWK